MHITLVTLGSLGDVYPFVALGLGLKAAGHEVLVVTHTPFEQIVRERGLCFAPVDIDPRTLLENEEGQSWLNSGGNALLFFRRFSDNALSCFCQPVLPGGTNLAPFR